MICNKCGNELNENEKYCSKCGNEIIDMPAEASRQPLNETIEVSKEKQLGMN